MGIVYGVEGTQSDTYYLDSKYRDPLRDCDYRQSRSYLERSTTVGGHPYYCPIGWKFIGIKINERETEDWAISYHGTSSHVFNAICVKKDIKSDQGVCMDVVYTHLPTLKWPVDIHEILLSKELPT